jgi:hypothetical protein
MRDYTELRGVITSAQKRGREVNLDETVQELLAELS